MSLSGTETSRSRRPRKKARYGWPGVKGGRARPTEPQGEIGKYGRGSGVPHPTDVLVGKRIRTRRRFLGMNQQTLADKLGLTFQQVQKYEAGANRVSASALSTIADTLRVPVSFFFANSPIDHDARMEQPETIELLRCYYSFANDRVRQHFLELVKVAAAAGKDAGPRTTKG
jgi:transcriptional regulator with XRE-family HTH domain